MMKYSIGDYVVVQTDRCDVDNALIPAIGVVCLAEAPTPKYPWEKHYEVFVDGKRCYYHEGKIFGVIVD